jgi:hypothetical protein
MSITLTTNEAAALTMIKDGKAEMWDGGWEEGSESWTDVFSDDVADLLGITLQGAGGVISSLIQKGLLVATAETVILTSAAIEAV